MATFTLAYYSVSINTPNDDQLPLFDFSETHDLLSAFTAYLNRRIVDRFNDLEQRKVFSVAHHVTEEKHIIKGIIKIGDYGMSSEIINIHSSIPTHIKSTDEADMTPHYFLAYFPPALNKGILILQKNSGKGADTTLIKDFTKESRSLNPYGELNFHPLIPLDYIEQLRTKGRFTQVKFIKKLTPQNATERYLHDLYDPDEEIKGYYEHTFRPERSGNLPQLIRDWLARACTDKNEFHKMGEMIKFDYNQVKMDVVIGGRKKVINLSNIDSAKTDIDITHEIQTDDGGHPIFDSIDESAKSLLHGAISDLGLQNQNDE